MEEKIVLILNEMSEYLSIAQMKKLQEVVLKTFSDYSDEVPVQYIKFKIPEDHFWAKKKVADIILPPETLLVLLQRGSDKMIPDGETVLLPEDGFNCKSAGGNRRG